MPRKGETAPVDWRLVFMWLEKGYNRAEIAEYFSLHPDTLSKKAKADLPPEQWNRWFALVLKNRKPPAAHGTMSGYRWHLRHRILPPCRPCTDAEARGRAELRDRERKNGQSKPAAPRPRPRRADQKPAE